MLNASYFNGEREKIFALLVAKAQNILSMEKKDNSKIDERKVQLTPLNIEGVSKMVGRDYLVPYYPEAKLIDEIPGVSLVYEVPGNFSNDKEHLEIPRELVTLNPKVVMQVNNHLAGRGEMDFGIGIVNSRGFVPPSVMEDRSNGQMKITVDVILSISDMIKREVKDRYRILVIGSGSPGGVRSGIAYGMIPYMCDADVDMYDPYEVPRKYTITSQKHIVNYSVFSREFNYKNLLLGNNHYSKFDLILDDSWVKGEDRNSRDVDDNVSKARNYSIKQFPWERGRAGNVYYQKFYTRGLEERRVSRDVLEVSQLDHPLGVCVACRELRLRLPLYFGSEFYQAFMNCHERDCVTGSNSKLEIILDYEGWIPVNQFDVNYDMYCSMNYDFIPGTRMVGLSFVGMQKVRFLFSERRIVPYSVLRDASQVLVIEKGEFFVNKLLSETVKNSKEITQVERVVNLAHSGNFMSRSTDAKVENMEELRERDKVFKIGDYGRNKEKVKNIATSRECGRFAVQTIQVKPQINPGKSNKVKKNGKVRKKI